MESYIKCNVGFSMNKKCFLYLLGIISCFILFLLNNVCYLRSSKSEFLGILMKTVSVAFFLQLPG